MPLLSSPLAIAILATHVAKLKGSSILITSCRGYVEKNIKKTFEMITKSWETSQSMASLRTREHDFARTFEGGFKK
jgi:hypothetical protein